MERVDEKGGSQVSAEVESGRREALKLIGAGAAVALLGKAAPVFAATGGTRKKGRLAMVIDLRRCTGCHSCAVACKAEFPVALGVWRSWVKIAEHGNYPKTSRAFLPRLCNHCEKPACVEACPTKALHKRDDGAVLIHEDICQACGLCISACPYKMRFFNPEKKVADKCTFCVHRTDEGIEPACVNTCPAKARTFGDLSDPRSEVSKLLASTPAKVLKPGFGTEPSVFYIGASRWQLEKV